ncbi:hypothetical protein DFH08DRAFT_859814 [Mycena albidolilacea]|uniref:Uncharacterized protein n=1 Tax=Mycena albidolilacea TaxID=1033008 RepID=A0AAD7A825_9AGAR|nr:hypothetical protein DFH08DRAFT_859814 [Mycena albidolilacea]
MYSVRATLIPFMLFPSAFALAFGTLGRRISVGQTTEITWTNDIADPPVWVLEVANRNGDEVATVDSVEGSAGQFSFLFPTVQSERRPFFTLRALSGNQVLATSAPFRVMTFDEAATGEPSSSVDTLPTISSFTPSSSSTNFQSQSSATPSTLVPYPKKYSSPIQNPTPSPSADYDSTNSNPTPELSLPALIAGPIIATVTLAVIIFISWTMCGCRRRRMDKLGEP